MEEVEVKEPLPEVEISEPIEQQNSDLRSKKFIAYLVSVIISLIGFIVVFFAMRNVSSFEKFLDFMLYSLIAFMGGNSLEHISKKIGK